MECSGVKHSQVYEDTTFLLRCAYWRDHHNRGNGSSALLYAKAFAYSSALCGWVTPTHTMVSTR